MTILIAVPLVALLLFGFTLSTEVQDLALGVLDESQTAASRRVIADLRAQRRLPPAPVSRAATRSSTR